MSRTKKLALSGSRWIVQVIMVVIVIGGASLRNLLHPESRIVAFWPELQGFCPFGAVQTIVRGLFDFSYLLRAGYSNQWVLLGVLVITLLFGAVFCSALCPLGSIQEWIGKLGKRLLKRRYNPPVSRNMETILKSFRFVVLGALFLSVTGVVAWNLDYINPSYALSHLWTSVVPLSAVLVLVLFLLLALLYERPWCRWFCPYGLVLGVVGRLSMFTIRRSTESCIDCKKCDRACPVHIPVSTQNKVSDVSCNRCMQCVSSCPIPQTLTIASPNKVGALRIRTIFLSLFVMILFFLPLGIAAGASWYSPASAYAPSAPIETSDFSPDAISPMISLSTLATQSGVAQQTLAELLGLPMDYDFSTLLVDIEEEDAYMDITVRFIRERMSEYLQK